MKIQFFALLAFFFLAACGGDSATSSATEEMSDEDERYTATELVAQTEAYETMMDAHDRVMPRMGQIAQMQQNLKNSMQAANVSEADMSGMEKANTMLEASYDGMMNWMRELKSVDDLREMGSQEKIMAYIEGENQKMAVVETQLNEGLTMARDLLGIDSEAAEKAAAGHDHDGHDHDHDGGNHDHDH
jgi:hypothetical protein